MDSQLTNNELKWYIVKTRTNCEFRAREAIRRLIKDYNLEGKISEILIPEKEVIDIVKGKKVTKFKKFYSGYIFVQMQLTNQVWHLVKNASGVINFVGNKGIPTEVPVKQIEAITHRIKEDAINNDSSKISVKVGEHVQVIDGPFKTFSGVVEEVNQEKGRVKVAVSIFGRPTSVELDFSQVYTEE